MWKTYQNLVEKLIEPLLLTIHQPRIYSNLKMQFHAQVGLTIKMTHYWKEWVLFREDIMSAKNVVSGKFHAIEKIQKTFQDMIPEMEMIASSSPEDFYRLLEHVQMRIHHYNQQNSQRQIE